MGCWQACALSLGLTPEVSSSKRDISYDAWWATSYPRNTVQNTAQASSWDGAFSDPAMGATFCLHMIRIMSAKEVKVPPPKIASQFRFISAASDPAEGERSSIGKVFSVSPTPSRYLV